MTVWEYLDRAGERRLRRKVDTRLFANVIGAALVAGFIGALIALFIVPIKSANKELLSYMLGQLSGFAGGIVAYHYAMTARQGALEDKRAESTGQVLDAAKAVAQAASGTTGGDAGSIRDGDRVTVEKAS